MNKSGKQQINNETVFEILKTAKKTKDGSFVFKDKENNTFLVDKDGGMFKIADNRVYPCNNGYYSSKHNGYLYVEVAVEIYNEIMHINYAQHSIVCALYNNIPYDYSLVVNHKDNCPWNNCPSNLEWTTNKLNVLHGRIVEAATHAHSSENSLAYLGYDLYKKQSNNKYEFDCLRTAISCKDIEIYEQYIIDNNKKVKSLKQYWGLTEKKSLLSLYKYNEFIQWLIKKERINILKGEN